MDRASAARLIARGRTSSYADDDQVEDLDPRFSLDVGYSYVIFSNPLQVGN